MRPELKKETLQAANTLYPFTAAEATSNSSGGVERLLRLDFQNINDRGLSLLDAIKRGTFPEIVEAGTAHRRIWFDGYITSILQRDVRQISELEKISLLPHLLSVLATRVGGLMNDSDRKGGWTQRRNWKIVSGDLEVDVPDPRRKAMAQECGKKISQIRERILGRHQPHLPSSRL